MQPVKMIPCNRNSEFSIKETEADYYCLLLTFKVLIPKEKRYQEDKRVVFVSTKDWPQYKKPETQTTVGWTELVILHDPTIKAIPLKEEEEIKAEPLNQDDDLAEEEEKKPIKKKAK